MNDEVFTQLAGFHGLVQLHITKMAITDSAMSALDGMQDLRVLHLYDNHGVTDAGLEHLTGLKKLVFVHVTGTQVTPEGIAKLRRSLPRVEFRGP